MVAHHGNEEAKAARGRSMKIRFDTGKYAYRMGEEGDGPLADWWIYEDRAIPHTRLSACAGFAPEEVQVVPMTYDEMRPGCYQQGPRLDDMDLNHVEASLCFPTFPRFCGQTFLENDCFRSLCAGVQRLDGRRVVRRPGVDCSHLPHSTLGPAACATEVRRNARRAVKLLGDAAVLGFRRRSRPRPALGPVGAQ
jgi:hypothetical protein